jgi:hypothetical protein
MITPILERPNVTNLLDNDRMVTMNPTLLNGLENFYLKYSNSEIIIQDHGADKKGIMIDAYNGEDNINSEIFYIDEWLPF